MFIRVAAFRLATLALVSFTFSNLTAQAQSSVAYTYTQITPAFSQANGINDFGQIVGNYADQSTFNTYGYSEEIGSNTYTTIDPLAAPTTSATSVNNAGQIVGFYQKAGGLGSEDTYGYSGMLGSNTYTTISPFDSTASRVNGINNVGQIVGQYENPTTFQTFGYSETLGVATQIDPFGSTYTGLTGINDSGQIVGFYQDPNTFQDYSYSGALGSSSYAIIDPFGSDQTEVNGINNAGQIVGQYRVPGSAGNGIVHGYIGTLGQSDFQSIDPFGSTYVSVQGINNAGELVGYYYDSIGHRQSFLGTPTAPVPEASAMVSFSLLLALGLGGAVIAAKRKKANVAKASTAA